MSNRMIVIGIGPIGGIIGGRLARAGHDITFVDIDKEHVAAIRENGLQIDVPDGPFNYAFGVAGVAVWPLVLGTLIGSAPRAFAYTALGDALDDPASPLAFVAIGVVVVTGAVGTVVALRLRRAS